MKIIKRDWKALVIVVAVIIVFALSIKLSNLMIEDMDNKRIEIEENSKICKELGYDSYNDWLGDCSKKESGADGYSYSYVSSGLIDFEKYKRENWK